MATKKKITKQDKPVSLQALHDMSVSNEILGRRPVVAGMELRPVTLESIILLKQINSPLIMGKNLNEIDNVFMDCCKFIVLQSVERKEARRLAWEEEALNEAALDLAAQVPATELHHITNAVNGILIDATSTAVEAKPKSSDPHSNPLGN